MQLDPQSLERTRLKGITSINDYGMNHERHRIFPALFENRNHKKIIDLSAGVGVVGKRIQQYYPNAEIICNDISDKCLEILETEGLKTVSFNLDEPGKQFPYEDGTFDAAISLATIEHLMNGEHFIKETHRILNDDAYLYLSAPNYAGLLYLLPVLITGKTFHDPLSEDSKYEFFAHVRYYTYRTLVEYISTFGFEPEAAYIGLPKESSRFLTLKKRSWVEAYIFKNTMRIIYTLGSPRWASEPVICFRKADANERYKKKNIRKVIL
jgi:ubiquinone/menaquinone biosynthesis C-methylase UbiE